MSLTPETIFNNLILNAFDYFDRSLNHESYDNKISTVLFYSGVEIIFKARLLREHWTLIIDEKRPNQNAFFRGQSQTVGLNECISRLQNILNEHISKHEIERYNELRQDRNKLVHFYHDDHPHQLSRTIRASWYYLHHRLTKNWAILFEPYKGKIEELHQLIKIHSAYLDEKFRNLEKRIKKSQAEGKLFIECPTCLYKSYSCTIKDEQAHTQCIMCNQRDVYDTSNVFCPECNENKLVYQSDTCLCLDCGFHQDTDSAYCSACEYYDSRSAFLIKNIWVCLACEETNDCATNCEWCGEFCTGDMEMSYLNGCLLCEGRGCE